MNNTALLVIDVQNGLFSDPKCPVYKEKMLIENIKKVIKKATEANIPIIYIQHTDDSWIPKGSKVWQIYEQIKPSKEDKKIIKFTPDAFYKTSLNSELKNNGIKNLVIVGLQTEYCIDTTCRRAFSLGFKTTLIKDAHSTCDSSKLNAVEIIEHHNQVLSDWFVEMKTADQINFYKIVE
ncbi:cysteine hydrolase family protein [Sporosalibacterium faouarense]|uniref:cysteine hydrolase family protein n=1 Tax=Sporosalibacterium faouarense TaxID=516123 RepID=UPI00192AA6DB|nr:cysteine hydrolase family protein [Sporosalibacterium faouarense]